MTDTIQAREKLGLHIKTIRKDRLKISRYRLAKRSGITPHQIRQIEKGSNFTIDSLFKIAATYAAEGIKLFSPEIQQLINIL